MKKLRAWGWAITMSGAALVGQTKVDIATQSKSIDFSAASATRPFKAGFSLPATCRPGEIFQKIDLVQGYAHYVCGANNVWTVFGANGGTGRWNSLSDANGNLAVNLGAYSTTLTAGDGTGSTDAFKITDGLGNTGTGALAHFTTAAGSLAAPWRADANGNGWQVDSAGRLKTVGGSASGSFTFGGATAGSCTLTVPENGGALVPATPAECDFGSAALPFANFYLSGTSPAGNINHFMLSGVATGARVWTLPDATDIFVGRDTSDTLTHKTFDTGALNNVLRVNGVQLDRVQGTTSSILLAGTVAGTGTPLCTDSNGNATTAGCAASGGGGGLSGPGTSTVGGIPVWSSSTGSSLGSGFRTVTTLGNPGVDTAIPTEAAVRAAISSSGGGTVSSISTGCGLAGGPITTAGTIGNSMLITSISSDYTVSTNDCGSVLAMGGSHAFTLPPAGSSGFEAGWLVRVQNAGTGSVTVATTGGAIYGGLSGSSVAVGSGQAFLFVSDGANWNVVGTQGGTGSGGSGGGSYTAGNGIRISTANVVSESGLCASAPANDSLNGAGNFATTCAIPPYTLSVGSVIDFVAAGTITGGVYNTYWGFPVKLGAATVIPSNPVGYEVPGNNVFVWEVRGTIVVTAIGSGGKAFGTAYMNQGNNPAFGAAQSGFFNMQSPAAGVTIDTTTSQTFRIAYSPNSDGAQTVKLTLLRVKVGD